MGGVRKPAQISRLGVDPGVEKGKISFKPWIGVSSRPHSVQK